MASRRRRASQAQRCRASAWAPGTRRPGGSPCWHREGKAAWRARRRREPGETATPAMPLSLPPQAASGGHVQGLGQRAPRPKPTGNSGAQLRAGREQQGLEEILPSRTPAARLTRPAWQPPSVPYRHAVVLPHGVSFRTEGTLCHALPRARTRGHCSEGRGLEALQGLQQELPGATRATQTALQGLPAAGAWTELRSGGTGSPEVEVVTAAHRVRMPSSRGPRT